MLCLLRMVLSQRGKLVGCDILMMRRWTTQRDYNEIIYSFCCVFFSYVKLLFFLIWSLILIYSYYTELLLAQVSFWFQILFTVIKTSLIYSSYFLIFEVYALLHSIKNLVISILCSVREAFDSAKHIHNGLLSIRPSDNFSLIDNAICFFKCRKRTMDDKFSRFSWSHRL